ncbi:hypothetical protein D893_02502 [Thioalkalivibrio sp. ALE21]|uniref:hypothetical protein n=1 Tax=Thioalkalivibrio sp. ALE21 TaxID=1158175 RepID=UPI000D9C2E3E|nr:hypothetical protein [Thioalkalivibrio sp. ALE21]PYF99992.1 hypothetical protein D893_02502 [Thioalkalivibrio sp. ALE21]
MNTTEAIERSAAECLRFAQVNEPPRLLESSLAAMSADQRHTLCGKKGIEQWAAFKERLLAHQADMGFSWQPTPGRGGPLSLTAIEPPAAAGKALGEQLLNEGVKEGRLDEVLKQRMPSVAELMHRPGIDSDLDAFRSGFKDAVCGNRSYRFAQGRSQRFNAATREYRYPGANSRRREDQLGDALLPWLKEAFDFARVEHVQSRRQGGRFENADFVGFRIRRQMANDEFVMYSFELKATNDIPAISQAISQAVNYRTRSNYTYIIIPLFDAAQFHDEARLSELLAMCRSNGIGALSVSIDPDGDRIADLVEVQRAEYRSLDDADWLRTLVDQSSQELCPLCRRIVDAGSRLHCGWKVPQNGDDIGCMKQRLEESVGVRADSSDPNE